MFPSYKKVSFFINKFFVSIFLFLFSLCFFIYCTFLSTPLYSLSIKLFNIWKESNLNSSKLLLNYRSIISYMFTPILNDLTLPDFTLSYKANYHFKEVKILFIKMLIFMIILFILLIYYFVNVKNNSLHSLFEYFDFLSKINILFISITITLLKIDFWDMFTLFHKLLFKNNYWLFNPKIDPVINILPKEFFMLCGIFICILFFLQSLYIKIFSKKFL